MGAAAGAFGFRRPGRIRHSGAATAMVAAKAPVARAPDTRWTSRPEISGASVASAVATMTTVLVIRPRISSGVLRSITAKSAAFAAGASISDMATGAATSGDGISRAAAPNRSAPAKPITVARVPQAHAPFHPQNSMPPPPRPRLAVAGLPALGRLFVHRVVGVAMVAPDERRDLVPDADRGPADQFPCAGDPDQEADDHQARYGVH